MQAACNWFSFLISSFLYCSPTGVPYHISIKFSFASLQSIKSGFLDVVAFRKLNSKSHTSFAWEFSKSYPLFHFSWHYFTFWSNRFCSFAHATATTMRALLSLARNSLLSNILHPAKRCCSCCSLHNKTSDSLPSSGFNHFFYHWHNDWCFSWW